MLDIKYVRVAALPTIVRTFCYSHDAWIVGSGAEYLLGLKTDTPRDWDILIPFWQWGIACKTIPEGSITNAHGGIKLKNDDVWVDVWAGDVGWFLSQVPSYPAYAVNPKAMIFLSADSKVARR